MPIAGLGAFLFFTPSAPSVPVLVDAQTQVAYRRPATVQLSEGGLPTNVAPPSLASFAPDAPVQQPARPTRAQLSVDGIPPSATASGWDHTPQTAQPPARPIVQQRPIDATPPINIPYATGWTVDAQRPPQRRFVTIDASWAFSGFAPVWWTEAQQVRARAVARQYPSDVQTPSASTSGWNFNQDIFQFPAKPIVVQRPVDATPPINVPYASGWPTEFVPRAFRVPAQAVVDATPPINIPYASGWVADVGRSPFRTPRQLSADAFPTSTVAAITAWEDSTLQRAAKPIVVQRPVDATPPLNVPYASGWVPPPQGPAKPIVVQRPFEGLPPSAGVWNFIPDTAQPPAKPIVVQRPYELTPPINVPVASGWTPPPQTPAKPIVAQRPIDATPPINFPYASGWVSDLQPRPRSYRLPLTADAFPTSQVVALTAWAEPVRQYGAKPIVVQRPYELTPPIVVRVGGFEPPPQAPPAPYPGRTRLTGTEPAPGVPAAIFRKVGGYDTEFPARRARRLPPIYAETVTGVAPFAWVDSSPPRTPRGAKAQAQVDAIAGPAPVAGFDGIVLFGRVAVTCRLPADEALVGPKSFAGFEGLAPDAVRAFARRHAATFDGTLFGSSAAFLDIPGQAILLDGTTHKLLLLDGASSGVALLDNTAHKIVMYDIATGSVVVADAIAWLATLEDKE